MGLAAQEAADLVQDVFVTLVQELPQFRYDPGKGLSLLAANRGREPLARRPAEAGRGAEERRAGGPGGRGRAGRGGRRVGGGISSARAVRAMQIMQSDFEEKTWKACWGLVVEGKSGAAVAAELGMTIDAVYAAKSRVLRRLRQELDGLMD